MMNKQGNKGGSGPTEGAPARESRSPWGPTTRAERKAARRRGQIRRATARWREKKKAAAEAKAREEARARRPLWRRPSDPDPDASVPERTPMTKEHQDALSVAAAVKEPKEGNGEGR